MRCSQNVMLWTLMSIIIYVQSLPKATLERHNVLVTSDRKRTSAINVNFARGVI